MSTNVVNAATTSILTFLDDPKRAPLEEVTYIYDRMLMLSQMDKELDAEMLQLAEDPATGWEHLWQTRCDELIEMLEKNDPSLFADEDSEEGCSSDEDADDLVADERAALRKTRSLRIAMEKQLSLLDKEKKFRIRRIDYFERFLDVESKRNDVLGQKDTLCMQIRDVLVAELNSIDVLVPEQEPIRREMITKLAKWWDCLLYNLSVELNQELLDEEVGKWSQLYLKWCLWIDLQAGILDDEIDDEDRFTAY